MIRNTYILITTFVCILREILYWDKYIHLSIIESQVLKKIVHFAQIYFKTAKNTQFRYFDRKLNYSSVFILNLALFKKCTSMYYVGIFWANPLFMQIIPTASSRKQWVTSQYNGTAWFRVIYYTSFLVRLFNYTWDNFRVFDSRSSALQ